MQLVPSQSMKRWSIGLSIVGIKERSGRILGQSWQNVPPLKGKFLLPEPLFSSITTNKTTKSTYCTHRTPKTTIQQYRRRISHASGHRCSVNALLEAVTRLQQRFFLPRVFQSTSTTLPPTSSVRSIRLRH